MKLSDRIDRKKARKWMWVGMAGLLVLAAAQIYVVQELLAALLLFAAVFIPFALAAAGLYLLDEATQRGFGWSRHHFRFAFELARRGWNVVEKISRKQFHRPHSAPVR